MIETFLKFSVDLYSGMRVSSCLQPCLRTVATVEEGTVGRGPWHSKFSLIFNTEVRLKKTSVDRFSFMDSLNFFGSNLGLWPGLGLFQILESMVGILLIRQLWRKITSFFM